MGRAVGIGVVGGLCRFLVPSICRRGGSSGLVSLGLLKHVSPGTGCHLLFGLLMLVRRIHVFLHRVSKRKEPPWVEAALCFQICSLVCQALTALPCQATPSQPAVSPLIIRTRPVRMSTIMLTTRMLPIIFADSDLTDITAKSKRRKRAGQGTLCTIFTMPFVAG